MQYPVNTSLSKPKVPSSLFAFFPSLSFWSCPVTLVLIGVGMILGGCEDLPRKDYEDYKKRTAHLRQPQEENNVESKLADIRGIWLINSGLSAGIALGLKVELTSPTLSNDDPLPRDEQGNLITPIPLQARIWLERQDHTQEDPIVIVDPPPEVTSEGLFSMKADPLILDPATLGVDTEVEAVVTLESQIVSDQVFCGNALGNVVSPLTLDLTGSTFYAERWKEGLLSTELANRCPTSEGDSENEAMGGSMGGNMDGSEGGSMGGGQVSEKPESPDLSGVEGQVTDISGHWLMNVKLSVGLPLKLWVAFIYTETETGGYLDGVLRRETSLASEPPIATFSADVGEDGSFEVWLPQFELSVPVPIEGDLLLSGVILPPNEEGQAIGWCGAAAGQTRRPSEIDLAGTTFYAHPWVPGQPAPDPLLESCPE